MAFQGEKEYTFISDGQAEDTFAVVSFSGHEAISWPYRFEIELATVDSEIDLRAMLRNSARFAIHRGDLDDRVFNGVLAEFEQMKESGGYALYKAVLVPRLWSAGLYHENQLFLEKSVPDIIREVLEQTKLTGDDYAFRLTGSYNPWEYLCQWRETDLNFMHRWMEREGIYYYFSQDNNKEKLIITDSAASHQNVSAEGQIPYSPPSGTVPYYQEVIQSMVCRQRRLPNKVILRDYNYRRPSLELKAQATVDAAGHGDVYFYGEHFKIPEEGSHLAKIRAQELLCRELVFNGESTAANLSAGYLFIMQDHYREGYNQQYLVVEVEHQGHQAIAGLSGQSGGLSQGEKRSEYSNRFTAIPADVQFRPERSAVKPKFYGTLNATVDAAGNGEYAEIDDQGRYKVIMPFDRNSIGGGRASRWIRMAQPYAGNEYGMHFPLHKNTEVLLTFIDGDPDRPIIAGTVPNPETMSPITSSSSTKSRIRTAAKNEIMMEDHEGAEMIFLSTPHTNSKIYMGAAASTDGIRSTTEGHGVLHAKKGIYLNAWPTDYWSTGEASQFINAGISSANVIGAAAAAAGAGKLAAIPAIMGIASAVANIALPGIVLSSPSGISAATPSTFTAVGIAGIGLFTPAVADIVGVTSASLMSGGGVNIFTVTGGIRCVAAGGDIDIHSKSGNIDASALQNIKLRAQTDNINLQAKKEVDISAETADIKLKAISTNIDLVAKNNFIAKTEEENIEFTAKKNIKGNAQDENIELTGKKKILITAEDEKVELKCGDASIVLEKSGKIQIKGKDIEIDGGSGPINIHGGKIDLN